MTWRRLRTRRAAEEAIKAARARERAEADLAAVRARSSEAASIVARLRAHRAENHFAELFGRAFGG